MTGAQVPSGGVAASLVVVAGGERYALPAGVVRAVVPRPAVTPVPYAPARVLGLIAWRGRVIPVVTAGGAAGAAGCGAAVVLQAQAGWVALAAERVEGFTERATEAAALDPEQLLAG